MDVLESLPALNPDWKQAASTRIPAVAVVGLAAVRLFRWEAD